MTTNLTHPVPKAKRYDAATSNMMIKDLRSGDEITFDDGRLYRVYEDPQKGLRIWFIGMNQQE